VQACCLAWIYAAYGGYIVAPRSSTPEGAYTWKNHIPPATVPIPLKALLVNGKEKTESEPFDRKSILDGIPGGQRDDKLYRYVCSLQAKGMTQAEAEILVREAAANCKPSFDQKLALEKVARVYQQFSKPHTGWDPPDAIAESEWNEARPTPDCIVADYLFADVAVLVAPGGTGKTTMVLYEAVLIVLGRDLYGMRVLKPGPVVIVTAEDSREILIARLREVVNYLELSEQHVRVIQSSVLILDVSGNVRRLTKATDSGAIEPAAFTDDLVAGLVPIKPVLVVIDPTVSFGTSEARVNDNEQALIESGRRIRNALNCCIRFIHHTGKGNARDATTDHYSGRGGSALADGARMVHVLQPAPDIERLTGHPLTDGEVDWCLLDPKCRTPVHRETCCWCVTGAPSR